MKKICVTILAALWLSPLAFALRPDVQEEITRVERAIRVAQSALNSCAFLLETLKPPPANASEEERKEFEANLKAIEQCLSKSAADLDSLKRKLAELSAKLPNVVQPPHREDPAIAQMRQRIKDAQKVVEEDQKKIDALKAKLKKLQNPR